MRFLDAMARLNLALYAGGVCLCIALLAFALSLGFGGVAWLNAVVVVPLLATVAMPLLVGMLLFASRS